MPGRVCGKPAAIMRQFGQRKIGRVRKGMHAGSGHSRYCVLVRHPQIVHAGFGGQSFVQIERRARRLATECGTD
jgi:hypothetical protein